MTLTALNAAGGAMRAVDLQQFGLEVREPVQVHGRFEYEGPAWIFSHRVKNCSLGAFTFFNAAGQTSAYCCRFGRYCQVGESSVLGPPEHPTDWFSSHPFAFGRPGHLPSMYRQPEFARLAPEAADDTGWAAQMPNETRIGHEVYIGTGCFVKRGVSIGDGAMLGARSVVTRDVPPYAVVVGSPARIVRLRFAEAIVERLLALQWWHYDLAPFKQQVDFSRVEQTLDFLEERQAAGDLMPLLPETFSMRRVETGYVLDRRAPLYRISHEEPS